MTEREFEQRLRAYYRAQVGAAGPLPAAVRESVWRIPDQMPSGSRYFQTRRGFVLLATTAMLTALLIGGAIAIGSGLLRLPWLPDDRDTVITGSQNGWVAYVVALTDWNTPGGPTYESPGSPTRIALVREGSFSPVYLGGVTPPEAGASTDDWLSVRQQCPTFSPDGTRLAYFERRPDVGGGGPDYRGTIVIAAIDERGLQTSAEIRIPDVAPNACPVWSPDSQRLAFANTDAGGTSRGITVAEMDGSERDLPNPAPSANIATLAWSPDSSAIAVVDWSFPNGFSQEGRLWLVPRDGGEPRLLYEGHTPLQGTPSWSPDGTRVAITTAVSPEPTPDANGGVPAHEAEWVILVVPLEDGEAVREIGRGIGPAWSPTGDLLAYLDPGPGGAQSQTGSVGVADLSSGAHHTIPPAPIPPETPLSEYNFGGGSGFWRPHPPEWAPDGKMLLFVGSDGEWGTSILLTAPPTGDQAPTAVSETWVAEWYGENPFSWQKEAP